MADEKGTWKRFQRLSFDSKAISKRAKQAETKTTKHAHRFVVSKMASLRDAKKHIVIWLLTVGVLITAVALQTMWYQNAYQTNVWTDGGTYAEAIQGPIDTLNPLFAATEAELAASKLLFSSLYQYDKTNHLRDDLATNTVLSKDERTYTITLRDDAYWSDEVKVTADDIAFTVGLMKSPDVRSVMYGSWNDVKVAVMDSRTVKFTLPSPYAAFSHALTFSILPKHILQDVAPADIRQNVFSVNPVSSGPFKTRLLQLSPDGEHKIANLSANESYYRGAPKLSRFAIHAYNTPDQIREAIINGEVNAGAGPQIRDKRLPKNITKVNIPIYSGVYVIFNTSSSALKDQTVRRALQIGTDTAAIRKSLGTVSLPLDLPLVNAQLSGSGIPKAPTYSSKEANKLLTSAGWRLKKDTVIRKKGKTPLSLRLVTIKNPEYETVANELASQWRKLGIEVAINAQDPESPGQSFVQSTLQPRDYDVLIYKLVLGADPDVYAYWHSSQASQLGYNFSNYQNDIADDSLTSARAKGDPVLRNEKYKRFAKQWLRDAPAVALYQPTLSYEYSKSVQPVITQGGVPTAADRYSEILYWSAVRTSVYKTP